MIKIGKTSTAVKKRYNDKTYRSYKINLRKKEDKNIIDYIEKEKEKGITPTELFRTLFKK